MDEVKSKAEALIQFNLAPDAKVFFPMLLPEELLHVVVGWIASDTLFIERQLPDLYWKYAAAKLLPLSVVNRQLRRICLPFLFAHVEIKDEKDVERLNDWCFFHQTFAMSIR